MKIEEYVTIRNEMTQRFRWTFEVIFFSILSTSTIISWLAIKRSEGLDSLNNMTPYLFIIIGLGIIMYLFWFYYKTLESIYSQGGYLAIFHELEDKELRWHILSRFQDEIGGKVSKWGRDGKNAGVLLFLLTFVNITGAPIFFYEKMIPGSNLDWNIFFVMILIIGMLVIMIAYIIGDLIKTKEYMHKNMRMWFKIKEELSIKNYKLEEKIKNEFLKNK